MAFKEARREVKKVKGEQKLIWLELVNIDLEKMKVLVVNGGGCNPNHEQIAQNRVVSQVMPQSHCAESTPEWGRMDHSSLSGVSFLVILVHSYSFE